MSANAAPLRATWPRRYGWQAAGLLLAVAASLGIVIGEGTGAVIVLALLGGIATFVILLRSGPQAELFFLMFAIELNFFSVEIANGAANIRVGMVATLLLAAVQFVKAFGGREKPGRVAFLAPMVCFSASLFLCTLINASSPYFVRGLASCSNMVLNLAVYVMLMRRLLVDKELFDRAARFLIDLNVLYAGFCILELCLHAAGLDPQGRLIDQRQLGEYVLGSQTDQILRPWSLITVTGSFLAAVCVLALAKALQPGETRRRRLLLSAFVMSIGVILSYARGPWLGLAFGLMVLAVLSLSSVRTALLPFLGLTLLSGLAVVSYVIVGKYVPWLQELIEGRIMALMNLTRGTAGDRISYWTVFIADGLRSPIFGRGVDAYRAFVPHGMPAESFVVEIFHAAGLLGLGLYAWLHLQLLRYVPAAIRSSRTMRGLGPWCIPFLAGYACLFLALLTNPGMWGAFYWMFLAFLITMLVSKG